MEVAVKFVGAPLEEEMGADFGVVPVGFAMKDPEKEAGVDANFKVGLDEA